MENPATPNGWPAPEALCPARRRLFFPELCLEKVESYLIQSAGRFCSIRTDPPESAKGQQWQGFGLPAVNVPECPTI
jgi:hypothetical protein